jgi:predicted membrane protein
MFLTEAFPAFTEIDFQYLITRHTFASLILNQRKMEYNYNETPQKSAARFKGKSVGFGILVIVAGLLLMARNTGILEPSVSRIIFSWEMLLVAIGAINLFSRHSIWSGFILMSIGVFFLLVNYFSLPFTLWHVFWPVLIIFVGLSMIFGAVKLRKHHFFKQPSTANEEVFEDFALFGGGEKKIQSQSFRGGKIIAVFGGSKIDLSQCTLAPGTNMIEVVAAFGGTSILCPADWNVKVEVFNIFGGYADKRSLSNVDVNKVLIIKGVTIFGGGEIRSF